MENTARLKQKPGILDGLERIDVSSSNYHGTKRAMDFCIALVAVILLIIPMAILLLCVYIDDPGKVIFAQARIGKDGKPFHIYKIRTMVASAPGNLSAEEFRDARRFVTRMGRFLRKSSLDELPQLINVLKGDMSIVGPRPPLPREVAKYDDYALQRLYITPGMTCYWQIQPGRNDLSFRDWVDLDIKYIRERSFLTDWKIILRTFVAVVTLQGR